MMTSEWRIPLRRVRRFAFWSAVAATSVSGTLLMAGIMASEGFTALEGLILALFVPTFFWINVPFWTAMVGAVLQGLRLHPLTLRRLPRSSEELAQSSETDAAASDPLGGARTALAVPIYNEDPDAVAQRLSIIARSLHAAGLDSWFDVHVLSDTDRPDVAEREEAAWARLQGMHPEIAFHYRRRERNVGRKAGNLAEFCRRCRADYRYLVVLDADSLMSAQTLRALVERMEANPRLALLQTVPLPIRQRTLFGRFVQFAAHLHGPLLATGLAFWQGDVANYWGHNAILRMEPFTRHARLPVLPGRAPLGGPILSHDFVEGALLRRAGWQVLLDPTLGGSWEEVPATLPDFGRRDRRWAQGSLQHLRLVGMPGLHPLSRMHFVLGALGYLSSALWFFTLLAGTAYVLGSELAGPAVAPTSGAANAARGIAQRLPEVSSGLGVSLLTLTGIVLFAPKLAALVLALLRRRMEFGGSLRLSAGALFETFLSVLLAPVMMLEHTRYVVEILGGRAVGWHAQVRAGARLTWSEASRAGGPATVVGVLWLLPILWVAPLWALWLTPIFAGLLLAVPVLRWTSAAGGWAPLAVTSIEGLAEAGVEGPDQPPPVGPRRGRNRAREQATVGTGMDLSGGTGVPLSPSHMRPGLSRTHVMPMYKAERALFDLQRGRAVVLRSGPAPDVTSQEVEATPGPWHRDAVIAPVEGLTPEVLDWMVEVGHGPLRVVIASHRARIMGWVDAFLPSAGASEEPRAVTLEAAGALSVARVMELASGSTTTLDGVATVEASDVETGGLELAHLARMLPAVVAIAVDRVDHGPLADALSAGRVLEANAGQARELARVARAEVVRVSEAPVPLAEAEHSIFTLFREGYGLAEHVAIQVGRREDWPDPVPVRLHSACLTGDLFGSLRCDCGEQLRGSMSLFAARGGGVLLYLAQEGRGIGLSNKFRAYTLQESGLDTIDADCTLGFGADERDYDVAIKILHELGIERVELLTNNPEKVQALETAGIRVAHRRPLHGRLNRHNLPYVRAKVHRAGHWLRDMLSESLAGD